MAAKSIFRSLRFLLRRLTNPLSFHRRSTSTAHHVPQVKPHENHRPPPLNNLSCNQKSTLICDVEGGLLISSSPFPYFMLVAVEAGGFPYFRGLLLLLLYPLLICCVGEEVRLKVMVMVCFCGIKKEGFRLGRSVLPKHFLEEVGQEGFEVLMSCGKRVCVSDMPEVMVEGFLKEYLGVEVVVGRQLKVIGGYYTGLMEEQRKVEELKVFFLNDQEEEEEEEEEEGDDGHVFGIGSYSKALKHPLLFSHCKEIHLVSEAEKRTWHPLPRDKYPKPLTFHDGRLAFMPTPVSTLAMYIWLPFGFLLAISRALLFLTLPYKLSIPFLSFTGFKGRFTTPPTSTHSSSSSAGNHHYLYVCNHRTLLDPLIISVALDKQVTAVTYSLSRVSEFISPIRTVGLTRDREEDGRRMEKQLSRGDLVVCPEGTTCREPFLLRFSPLFAELTDEVIPVALDVRVGMFYGTTASGFKCLDPFFFLMNPSPFYAVEFLGRTSRSKAESNNCSSRYEMANSVQAEIGKALGFECTTLTRKDKYLMLAGNNGDVQRKLRRHQNVETRELLQSLACEGTRIS